MSSGTGHGNAVSLTRGRDICRDTAMPFPPAPVALKKWYEIKELDEKSQISKEIRLK
ncbi:MULTISPECIES: hypothetical protein [unclassified Microcoleus]|uniref:hypothetical protein n=1 Tax=unclassified Microcoleus TaxID=2642155 RepID=UPI002FCF586D